VAQVIDDAVRPSAIGVLSVYEAFRLVQGEASGCQDFDAPPRVILPVAQHVGSFEGSGAALGFGDGRDAAQGEPILGHGLSSFVASALFYWCTGLGATIAGPSIPCEPHVGRVLQRVGQGRKDRDAISFDKHRPHDV
jgi:hypothetical protein